MKEWFSIQELLGISGLPNSDRGIMKKADREQWQKRQREGVKGKAYEYHLQSDWLALLLNRSGKGKTKELEELIDKHRDFQGYYTGSRPQDKPDDYQCKVGIDKATFLKRVEEASKPTTPDQTAKTKFAKANTVAMKSGNGISH